MSFYGGESSVGSCYTCGSPVRGGGQGGGAYCSNARCPNSYLGGKTPEQVKAEQMERRRKSLAEHPGWWSVYLSDDKTYPSGYGSGLVATRDEAVRIAARERARGLKLRSVQRVLDGEMVDVDDDLLPPEAKS